MLVHKKAPGNTRRTNTKETSRHEAADYRKASIVTDSHDNRVIVIIFFLQLVSDFFGLMRGCHLSSCKTSGTGTVSKTKTQHPDVLVNVQQLQITRLKLVTDISNVWRGKR